MAHLRHEPRDGGGRLGRFDPRAGRGERRALLLSAAGGNVKVRYGLMDIKLLREVDAGGLERWEPVLKAGFPLPAAEVSRVFDALGILPPLLTRDAYTLDQFLHELVQPSGAVRAVRVHERRVRYTLGGCLAEIADLEVDGRGARTVAIESEDPSAVMAAVRSLGLDGQLNTSYPRGRPQRRRTSSLRGNRRRDQLGQVPYRRARPLGRWRAILDRAEVTRLGENLEHAGAISAEPLERTVAAIAGMVEEASRHQVRTTAAVARPACGPPATATRSSRRSGTAPESPSR
jgi:exopolyphosphatase/guanosine-5'-triphosphate,3'-diphosphate pyrophosphatase